MNRWQKIAWFNLIVIVVGSVISVIAAETLPPDERLMPPNRLTVIIIISLVLVVMAKPIFRKSDKGVDFDERDAQIHRRAKLFGWAGFGLGMAATIMVCYIAVGPMGSFPPLALPIILLVGVGCSIIVESIAALIQYGWAGKGEKS
ncbi:MAG: hypothetical protein ACYS9C_18290 [Planctomycetota bacterium]|jgi:hypothetical protein